MAIDAIDVFKFVALRPPVSVKRDHLETNFIIDERPAEQTPVGKLVNTFDKKDGSRFEKLVESYIKSNGYILDFPENEGDFRLSNIMEVAASFESGSFSQENLTGEIEKFTDQPLALFLALPESRSLLDKIWDRYYAFYILSGIQPHNLEVLTRGLRAFHIMRLAAKYKITTFEILQRVISAQPLVSALFTSLPKPAIITGKQNEARPEPEKIHEYTNLWTSFVDVQRALEEVKRIKFDTGAATQTSRISVPGRDQDATSTIVRSIVTPNKKSLDSLHAYTKAVLSSFDLNDENFQLAEPLTQLQEKLEGIYQSMMRIDDVEFINRIPAEAKAIPGIAVLMGRYDVATAYPVMPFAPPTNVRAAIKPLGIGELKVVKQTLRKYSTGEVAHIENVLRGEYKDRTHRELDRTEDIFTVTSETSEETTKDTQTTDRFELKKESELTIQEQMSMQAGVTVSGSYGVVTFGAHGDFAYSTSTQEATKNSSNFAHEVVDKSISKIQKKTKEERTVKKLHEVEEINKHGIDNKGAPEHVIGIYRWVDKYYEAQIYNYGKRMMFEFIIPEPAAFYEFAQTHKPQKDIVVPTPLNALLTHKNITEYNYQNFIRDYSIQGITQPPPLYKTVSIILSSDANIQNGTSLSKSSKELIMPDGYRLDTAGFTLSAIYENNPQLKLSIGANDLLWATITDNDARRRMDLKAGSASYTDGIIPVSINCYDINSFFVNVTATCIRTANKYEQWQIQTFEKIMAAYKAAKMEYDEKIAAQEVQQGIGVTGQNPLINRQIEKVELKKQSIKLLMDTFLFGSFDAMKDGGANPPDFDIFDAVTEGKTVQFFEQAFEWENITYLFYPYFWARKNQWMHKSTIFDNDPLFTQFLQAGSARIVVPVYPAYNDAVMYFLENNGTIWNGGEAPRLNDPLYISLADELRNQTDDLGNAIAEGDPWEVVLPTTLVYLQQDSVLPSF